MNVWDVILGALIALGLFFAVRRIRRGGAGCSGNCASCARACATRKE